MHVGMRGTFAAFAVIFAVGLAGCSNSGTSLLPGATDPIANNEMQAPATAARSTIAIAPVIGAPASVAKQIVDQLGAEAQKSSIAVAANVNDQVDYTIRGYIVAARESTGTKVSYIWDVTNPTGARVHRITGEEVVSGAGAGDPWASVSPEVIAVIAAKTSQQLKAWMPQKAPPSAAPAVADNNQNANQLASAAGSNAAVEPGTSSATTGSIGRVSDVTALVPQVVGAPGDGSTSLAAALRNELLRNGVKPTPPGQPAYRVEGRVKMGPVTDGQQPIKIDWMVRDPKGVNLGTVSQENKIPAGSLNGNWGSTATAAATAATQGILKLLPQKTASR
ncbi:MAG: hypothetical protein KKB37_13045 [Alphaproteobacteria bacterium]|nr:hypothetical protein [Alphaproteobacteria bacterium]